MIVNVIPGLTDTMRLPELTLTGFFREATMGIVPPTQRHQHVVQPENRRCIVDSAEYIITHKEMDSKLFMVGRSLGAIRTWWILRRHWNQLKGIGNISVVLIDPHGHQPGDNKNVTYGRGHNKLLWDNRWTQHPAFQLKVLFQRNNFPRGASFDGAPCSAQYQQIGMSKPANHWNMTNIETDTGKKVAEELARSLADLMHK